MLCTKALETSVMVTSVQPNVRSLQNRSYFARYKSFFAPCKKLRRNPIENRAISGFSGQKSVAK